MISGGQYTKLPGIGNTAGDGWPIYWYRCYLGTDHVLIVRRSRYGETYRRVYLDDIQSVYYCEDDSSQIASFVLFPAAATCAALGFVFASAILAAAPVGAFLFFVAAAALFVVGAVNLLLGPSVECWIRTARGASLVPNVSRLGAARRFSAAVTDAVQMQQGVVEAESSEGAPPVHAESFGGPVPVYERIPGSPRILWIAFLIEAAYGGLVLISPETFPPGYWILFAMAVWLWTAVAQFRPGTRRWRFPMRALMLATMCYVSARGLFWILYEFLMMTEGSFSFDIYLEDFALMAYGTILVNVLLAGMGFLFAERRREPPPPPPAMAT